MNVGAWKPVHVVEPVAFNDAVRFAGVQPGHHHRVVGDRVGGDVERGAGHSLVTHDHNRGGGAQTLGVADGKGDQVLCEHLQLFDGALHHRRALDVHHGGVGLVRVPLAVTQLQNTTQLVGK